MKLSLIIPTYNEKENIQKLIPRLRHEFAQNQIDAEIIIVDDNSPDGTKEVIEELRKKYPNIQTVHRSGKLGLSSAVVEGFQVAAGDILGVMDADLSHPIEKIGQMYALVAGNADLVIGSRYVKGGKIEDWNLYRKILSFLATLLARIFVNVQDPMSGFFMIRKDLVADKEINPRGFKILLELLIKTEYKNVVEVPITFVNRVEGKSKAGFREIVYFLHNLIGYLPYKKEIAWQFLKFAFVGLIGTFVNIFILYILTEYARIYYLISALCAFLVALSTNFIFNKIWTFGEKIDEQIKKKYYSFFLVSVSALSVNLSFLYILTEFLGIYYIISEILAIGISLMINFIGNKIWTFRR